MGKRSALSVIAATIFGLSLGLGAPSAVASGAEGKLAATGLECWGGVGTTGAYEVNCAYNDKRRGYATFEPDYYVPGSAEALGSRDQRADGRYVKAYVSWYDNGSRRASVTDKRVADGYSTWNKPLWIPERRRVHVWVCIEGLGCSAKYRTYA